MDQQDCSRVREAVERRLASFERAERALDAPGLLEHFSSGPDVYLYNDGHRVSYGAMAATVRQTFPTLSRLEGGFHNVDVHVLAADAALVTGQFRETITAKTGAILRQLGAASWLWQLEGGEWRIAYGHVDHYPDDSPETRA